MHARLADAVAFDIADSRLERDGVAVRLTNAFTYDIAFADRDANASTLGIALACDDADSLSHIVGYRDGLHCTDGHNDANGVRHSVEHSVEHGCVL